GILGIPFSKENGGENGTVLLTDCQTAGRGRRGRSWISPVGVNVYFSILLRPDLLAERASMITLVAAMALARAVEEETKLEVNIKWPNDVVVNGKKICGILTESSTDMEYVNYVVVGIGVNCNQQEFSDEIKETATSISIVLEKEINRNLLLASFMNQFEHYYSVFLETEDLSCLQEEYNALLINCGREVKVIEKDSERILTAVGIDATGALIVQNDKGEQEAILSGEVSVRGIYGYV
ncbi:MAG: biotin--[acetyl-CoA-carboxylase] ligase, partial [Eubacteriales bacterium]|nr:biotin--[acetyl-CoA-carboxylase] ligase [Eubacteriales bacterium]